VRHHHPGQGGVLTEHLINPLGQLQPLAGPHRGTPHPEEVFALDLGDLVGLRDARQHLLDAQALAELGVQNIIEAMRTEA
jgi:hypothetical protein